MHKITVPAFITLFIALSLTAVAYNFFPSPYNRDIMLAQGLSNKEANKKMASYMIVGLILLFITTSLFYKAIIHSRA